MSDIGAISPGRWHVTHERCRMGATSLVNVTDVWPWADAATGIRIRPASNVVSSLIVTSRVFSGRNPWDRLVAAPHAALPSAGCQRFTRALLHVSARRARLPAPSATDSGCYNSRVAHGVG